MTLIKSARKIIKTDISVSIDKIVFNSQNMSNKIIWSSKDPSNEKIISYDLLVFENDTSSKNGSLKKMIEFGSSVTNYVHKGIEIISNNRYFKTYAYQVIAYTPLTSKASQIEKFDPREIYEINPPKQITFLINSNGIYFSMKCDKNVFATNIFVFRKKFSDDIFERIAVLPYGEQISYTDKDVSLGSFYEYRFMSYDLFGHFSQKIVKIDIFCWNKNYGSSRTNVLFDPIPFAQFARESSNNQYIKLKISNIDPRCLWYKIGRRDISEQRNLFEEVEQWPSGSLIKNTDVQEIEFFDSIVRSGSYYQYSVYGLDKYSNKTDIRQSNVVYCGTVAELPATPINLDGKIINSYPTAVKLTWVDDNLNQKLDDIISGSSDLFPRDNLYYFKVFRRRYDELNYESFPEQSGSEFTDSCDDDGVVKDTQYPSYQPTPPMRDTKYYYYVSTYDAQTNVQSNRSNEILVDLTVPPSQVTNVESYYNNIFEPLKVILTWKTDENEKTLDMFVIDRIEDNKVWVEIGKSYFSTQFVDTTIKRNKKYIYRIRARDFNGNMGLYSYITVVT
ncbi:MAG: hypothetical protein WC438_05595 [Candidatus Pacearchaeota archaeon]